MPAFSAVAWICDPAGSETSEAPVRLLANGLSGVQQALWRQPLQRQTSRPGRSGAGRSLHANPQARGAVRSGRKQKRPGTGAHKRRQCRLGARIGANSQARRCRMLAISRRALSGRALVRAWPSPRQPVRSGPDAWNHAKPQAAARAHRDASGTDGVSEQPNPVRQRRSRRDACSWANPIVRHIADRARSGRALRRQSAR